MRIETQPYDASEYLDSPEMIAAYLEEAFEDGDPSTIVTALGAVARAKGMTGLARDAGLARESLYRALSSDSRPEFATIAKVLSALGLRLSVNAKAADPKRAPKIRANTPRPRRSRQTTAA